MDYIFAGLDNKHDISVLIVDDEDYVADMLATVLSMEGFTTHVAYNGRIGLEKAQQYQVNLLIVDIMMPHLNGLELINSIRDLYHNALLPAIIMSAGVTPNHTLNHTWFKTKPFDLEEMLLLIASVMSSN